MIKVEIFYTSGARSVNYFDTLAHAAAYAGTEKAAEGHLMRLMFVDSKIF